MLGEATYGAPCAIATRSAPSQRCYRYAATNRCRFPEQEAGTRCDFAMRDDVYVDALWRFDLTVHRTVKFIISNANSLKSVRNREADSVARPDSRNNATAGLLLML